MCTLAVFTLADVKAKNNLTQQVLAGIGICEWNLTRQKTATHGLRPVFSHAVVKAQNNLTQQVLAGCDSRAKFKALMTEMFDFPKTSCPFQRGEAGGVLR